MASTQKKLSVQEEVILALYRMLYGKPYDCHPAIGEDGINAVHVNAQKASFLFSEMMVPAGNYGFCWNHRGPYSERLQGDLRLLDQKEDLIRQYYSEFDENPQEKLDALFNCGQQEKIERASDAAREIVREEKGGELLGSLLYIGRTVLPGRSFEQVNDELQLRKEYFDNPEQSKRAWRALQELDLVSAG